ncbi:YjiH family protein [Dasania sp. GY-MA-18]|uniref:YjiH family protein n=1 Tax=Dasania phycosphaerae TaxID=2950436 RepID=A0A9J6RMK4_9GAMM|nr:MULTISPECIES: YjiH family protein [Dasania]MCR8922976.1 YjiH family protein [Dasania sp. GY-MA-18]MCZ0865407.1 YjiH family protein [Dasania phycosphaerae]MCZ0869132.1 YjiH family protein [Dasania phycosphaerae]
MNDQVVNSAQNSEHWTRANFLKFLIPSLLGVGLFLVPVEFNGKMTVLLGMMAELLKAAVGSSMAHLTTFVFVTSAVLSLFYSLASESWTRRTPALAEMFQTTPIWLILRVVGGVFSTMTLLQYGPEWVIGKSTGVTAFVDVAGIIFCLIGIGCLLLPLLTDYGFLEFAGTMLRKVFQKVFGLPGRSTIDALASWVGSSSIAVLVTIRQYETGFYSMREASVIATNFSVVSVPFVVLTAQVAGVSEYFFQLYGAMVLIGVICAIVTPKLPPLSRIPDEYYPPVGKQIKEAADDGRSLGSWAIEQALARASKAPSIVKMLKSGFHSLLDLFFTMMPAAMAIEFLALATYEYTTIFHFITTPLVPILELLQIPEAHAAAPGVVVGLLDQFVPAIIAGGIDNPITSFVLAGLSVTQLIFFAESAILIMRSKIPLSVPQLIAIFALRTTIALPILTVIAHIMF